MMNRIWMLKSTPSAFILNAHRTRLSGCDPDPQLFGVDYTVRGFCKIPEVLTT